MNDAWCRLGIVSAVFLLGLAYVVTRTGKEGFSAEDSRRCPNVLVKDGCRYYLYNTSEAKVPGVNPIEFANLEDYVEFTDWLRSRNIRCPVLHVEKTFNTQGQSTYHPRPSPEEIDAARPEKPTACCPDRARHTKRASDKLLQDADPPPSAGVASYDAMDPSWAGVAETRAAVSDGEFRGDEVAIAVQQH